MNNEQLIYFNYYNHFIKSNNDAFASYNTFYTTREKSPEHMHRNFDSDDVITRSIVSLREISKYEGRIVIFFYGMILSDFLKNVIDNYDVEIIFMPQLSYHEYSGTLDYLTYVINNRYIHILLYLNKHPEIKYIINIDTDMWMNESLDDIFNDCDNTTGVIFTRTYEMFDGCIIHDVKNKFNNIEKTYKQRVDEINKNTPYFKGTLSACFMSGNRDAFVNKCLLYKQEIKTYTIPWLYGVDQFFVNQYFDKDRDIVVENYGFPIETLDYKNVSIKEKSIFYNDMKIVGIHKGYKIFDDLYPELVKIYYTKLNEN